MFMSRSTARDIMKAIREGIHTGLVRRITTGYDSGLARIWSNRWHCEILVASQVMNILSHDITCTKRLLNYALSARITSRKTSKELHPTHISPGIEADFLIGLIRPVARAPQLRSSDG